MAGFKTNDDGVDASKIDTNEGALTAVSNEVAKYSDLISKADNNSVLKINRNPLLENNHSIYEADYYDLNTSLKDILSCLDNVSLKRSSELTLDYLRCLSNCNSNKSIYNQADISNFKSAVSYSNIKPSPLHPNTTRYSVGRRYSNSLKSKLLSINTIAAKKNAPKSRLRSLSLKKKSLRSIFYNLKLLTNAFKKKY